MKKLFKYSIIIALLAGATSPVHAASKKVEEAKARAAIRKELDWNELREEERNKARDAIRSEIDKDALRKQEERNALDDIRRNMDKPKITRNEEERIRQNIRDAIDQDAIYQQEWNRLLDQVVSEHFNNANVLKLKHEIYAEKYAGIETSVTQMIYDEVARRAKQDAENQVYGPTYERQKRLIQDRVAVEFQDPAIRLPIEENARKTERARIENEEISRMRQIMQNTIRSEIEQRCHTGEIELVSRQEKERIEAEVIARKTEVAKNEFRKRMERECTDNLTQEQRSTIEKLAYESVMGDKTAQRAAAIKEQKERLLSKVQTYNKLIRFFNWWMLFPQTMIDEWNETLYVQQKLEQDLEMELNSQHCSWKRFFSF